VLVSYNTAVIGCTTRCTRASNACLDERRRHRGPEAQWRQTPPTPRAPPPGRAYPPDCSFPVELKGVVVVVVVVVAIVSVVVGPPPQQKHTKKLQSCVLPHDHLQKAQTAVMEAKMKADLSDSIGAGARARSGFQGHRSNAELLPTEGGEDAVPSPAYYGEVQRTWRARATGCTIESNAQRTSSSSSSSPSSSSSSS